MFHLNLQGCMSLSHPQTQTTMLRAHDRFAVPLPWAFSSKKMSPNSSLQPPKLAPPAPKKKTPWKPTEVEAASASLEAGLGVFPGPGTKHSEPQNSVKATAPRRRPRRLVIFTMAGWCRRVGGRRRLTKTLAEPNDGLGAIWRVPRFFRVRPFWARLSDLFQAVKHFSIWVIKRSVGRSILTWFHHTLILYYTPPPRTFPKKHAAVCLKPMKTDRNRNLPLSTLDIFRDVLLPTKSPQKKGWERPT